MMSDGSGPPVLIGEKVWWLGSGSGLPKRGVVRWIGRLPEIGPDWSLGIELEEGLPYGGVDGSWRGRELFKCKPKHGLIVPSDRVLAHHGGGGSLDTARRGGALLPFQQQVAAPPRLKRHQERSLLLDRHSDFRSVHLEAVQIHRRLQQDQVVSLVLGQAPGSTGDVVLSRGMSRTEAVTSVVPRPRRTESLAARKEKTNSGLFSFLRWFRKENKTDRGEERSFSNPSSPVLRRSDSAITGSVDTLFSTATATSFAYVHPESYRPFGEASEPEKWIFPGPETNTYRNRIKTRDELRRLNDNLSLRRKYNLYASGSLGRSLDEIFDDRSTESLDRLQEPSASCSSTLARKKRKAPAPPVHNDSLTSTGCDSLPTTLSKESLDDFRLHRRTVSESAKYKKKAYHVKGKRKAPPPPNSRSQERESSNDLENNTSNTFKKKRKAPPPPIICQKGNVVDIPKEVTLDIIENDKLKPEVSRQNNPSTSQTTDQEVESISSTDTLRLEKGILKPNKMDKEYAEPTHAPTSPVSPRPWYKRPQSSGSSPKQSDWKKKETKSIEDWMLESGFPRRSQGLPSDSRFSIFGRTDRPEDKRRSQISILTNISELDREAAEIIQRGKEREKSLLASYNAKYYVDSADVELNKSSRLIDEGSQTDAVPRKATAKELISLFNSITNVSRVTLNSNFVTQNENIVFKKVCIDKPGSALQELKYNDDTDTDNPNKAEEITNGYSSKEQLITTKNEEPTPGPSRYRDLNGMGKRVQSSTKTSPEGARISKVTIEELEEYDSEKNKSQLYKENKASHQSSITPVITELSESSMKSSSGSTICSSLLNDSSSSLSSGSSSGAKIRSSNLFSHSPLQKKLSVWTCSRCTLENPRWRLTCEACDMWRPTVCDYKLCKKPSLSDDQPDTTVVPRVRPNLFERYRSSAAKELDKETTNLIRNGQVLASLVSQSASSGIREKSLTKLNSPKATKKELSCEPSSNNKGHSSSTKDDNLPESDNVQRTSPSSYCADEDQAEVVRKARIAFFNKTDTKIEEATSTTDKESVANNMDNISKVTTNDKLKLRELLKEMKNSLPKQKKLLNSSSSAGPSQSTSQIQVKSISVSKPTISKQNSLAESTKTANCESNLKFSFDKEEVNINNKSDDEEHNDVVNKPTTAVKLLNANSKVKYDSTTTSFLNKPDKPPDLKLSAVSKCVKSNDKLLNTKSKAIINKPVIVDSVTKSGNAENNSGADGTQKHSSPKQEINSVNKPTSVLVPVKVTMEPDVDKGNAQNRVTANAQNEKKAQAILIKSEIIIEETKIKKKPEKVSSSAQTSTKVLSLDENSKSSDKNEEVIVPVKNEEYILSEDGSLASTSVRVEPMKVDLKKFELMRPRDFTSVKPSTEYVGSTKTTNNLEQSAVPSTSSSGSSIHDLNMQASEPTPGPSTHPSKGNEGAHMGTVALNRLLRRLESAISGGQHDVAALLATELARLKVPCSVVRQPATPPDFLINVLVEDKTTQRGPIPVRVRPTMTLVDLKRKMEKEHDIPSHLQRWFIDKKLASDEKATLKQLGIQGHATPVFLYLVASEMAEKEIKSDESKGKVLNAIVTEEANKIEQTNSGTESDYPVSQATLPSTQSLGWKCTSCSLMNKRGDKTCKVCGISPSGASSLEQVTLDKRLQESSKTKDDEVSGSSKLHDDGVAGGSKSQDNAATGSSKTNGDIAAGTSKIQDDTASGSSKTKAIKDTLPEPQPSTSSQTVEKERQKNYERLVALEKDELVVSIVGFECPVCFMECLPPEGVVLRECLHSFCRACLSKTVEYSEEAEVKCPFRDDAYTCNSALLEREIKALVSAEVYEEHLAKSIAQAETKIANAFHCKTPDCKGWCIYEDNVNLFKCPVCLHSNCLTCQAIHDGLDCKQYQEQLNQDSEVNIEAKRTKDMLQEMVDRGEAMPCPRCKVVLMKKWGCDWLRCSMCKTEICWVTRGPRWGPNGKGDTSGGCQCGLNGVKCHPKCNYCH